MYKLQRSIKKLVLTQIHRKFIFYIMYACVRYDKLGTLFFWDVVYIFGEIWWDMTWLIKTYDDLLDKD